MDNDPLWENEFIEFEAPLTYTEYKRIRRKELRKQKIKAILVYLKNLLWP
jgi:hypothetical protein